MIGSKNESEMPQSLISVVIPTYNRSTVLQRAVESILEQTYQNFEVLIVDDGSTDETESVVGAFTDDRIQYIRFSENQGANAARNAGVEAANGEYIAFLDVDDEWKSTKLERQIEAFEQASETVGMVYTGIVRKDSNSNVISRSLPQYEGDVLSQLTNGNFIGTFSSVMVLSSVLKNISLNEDLPSWQDWYFYLEIAENWDVIGVSECLTVKHTDRQDQISKDYENKLEVSYPILQNKLENICDNGGSIFTRQVQSTLDFRVGYNALANEKYSEARRLFARSLFRYPFQVRGVGYFIAALGGQPVYKSLQILKRKITKL